MGLFRSASSILTALGEGLWEKFAQIFLAPGSLFSLASLGCALLVAIAFVSLSRRPGKRWVRPKVLWRALFPRRIVHAATTRADFGLFLFNVLVAGVLFSGLIVSTAAISKGVHAGLASALGQRTTLLAGPGLATALLTVTAFLAYEFGYWFDHFLKHKVSVLWEFHKVHHTAQALTPLTNFRMHPVDSILFGNILAVTIGLANGLMTYVLGSNAVALSLSGSNVILVGFVFLLLHLQHTHLWIAFTGPLGRLFVSPAHHQLHHSANPDHFGHNLGSCLAVWDWMFGTLLLPTRTRQPLTFGVSPVAPEQHGVTGVFLSPFTHAARLVGVRARRLPSARPI